MPKKQRKYLNVFLVFIITGLLLLTFFFNNTIFGGGSFGGAGAGR